MVYVNPNEEMAKVRSYMITHWGYHDESETEETWSMIPIEKAIRMVYPNEKAIRIILENTKQDHTQLLKELSEKHKKA